MPYISTEALVGAALLVVLAVGYQYLPKAPGGSGSNAAKKKGKKRSKPTPAEEAQSEPAAKTGSKGKRKPSGSGEDVSRAAQAAKQAGNSTSMPDEVTNGSPSFAAVAGGSQSAMPKTLVERLAPKARKTKVDDMLAPEDRPATHARVMKVTSKATSATPAPAPEPTPASAPTLAAPVQQKISNYEADFASSSSEDETSGTGTAGIKEDDGWDVVPSKKKKTVSVSMTPGSSQSSTSPLPVSTKIQRKNAKKSEAKKAAKAADEADRQRRLAVHKRDIEKERITEIYNQKKGTAAKATLDAKGKLIWE